ncbi:endopeptidase La [Clostridium massiliamazoniense]|uniref:endopeptidase La n=1 Tax=Clostridium massiliamazoniense TaxID=1347366 RepID=UPI0006D776CF|nr:endopeptidase La [Clostridium massiliamazoniense]
MKEVEKRVLPIIALRGTTIFPNMVTYFDVGRKKSVNAVKYAIDNNLDIFIVPQKEDKLSEVCSKEDLLKVGTLCNIKQIVNFNNGTMRVLVEGISRGRLESIEITEELISGSAVTLKDDKKIDLEVKVLKEELLDKFNEFIIKAKIEDKSINNKVEDIESGHELVDVICAYVVLDNNDKKNILELIDLKERIELLIKLINKEIDIISIEKNLKNKLSKSVEKNQKQYYLREQLNIIKKELGDTDDKLVKDLRNKVKKLKVNKDIKEKLYSEIEKIDNDNLGPQEKSVIQNYIEEVLEIPWGQYSKDNLDIKNSREILDKAHYGLNKIKEEVLEYLSVKSFNEQLKLPVLCLVGPPGVGKTSIAKSIAESLGRNFERISLGGISDEAEIRGHRKTYVGAMPGRIVTAIKKAKTMNPVLLLDEIDKIGMKYQGDHYSALLEVLDKEQNENFRDHYLEIPLDLSDALIITTANSLENIPRPLLDRMSILQLSGYTYEEKKYIAKEHLVPKALNDYGAIKESIKISDNALDEIINYYTRESGVRQLNRVIIKVIRKSIKDMVEKNKKHIQITKKSIEMFLGDRLYTFDDISNGEKVGLVNGMAWTAYGGDTLTIEALLMDGTGKLDLTGNLGDVMKESAKAAYSHVRANSEKYKIKEKEFYKNKDIHIHVPEGAVPKDGPSAGITMVTALVSLLSNKAVKQNVAMTGEVTLRGNVLPIGGLKEKILAASRVGIDTVIIPKKNEKDLKDIPKKILESIKVIAVENVEEVLSNVLV